MYRIEVDALPPTLNAFYSGMHWSRRRAIVSEWHGLFYAALLDADVPKSLKTPVILNVTQFCKGHLRDADNSVVAAKLLGDTLKDYGYIPDDGPEYIQTVILTTKKGEKNKTVILIQTVCGNE